MDMNEYVLENIALDRLAAMRAERARADQVRAAKPSRRPLRVALGDTLIRMGQRLQRVRGHSSMTIDAADIVN
jgi:hypothetical protein